MAECCRLRLFSPPGMCLSLWLLTAHCVSRLHPQSLPTPSIAVHGFASLHSTVNSDRYGLRVERLPPPSHYRFPRHRSCVTVSGRCHCAYDNKLSLTAPLLSAVNPKPPLAFPSRRCLDAALLPTFRTLAILPGTFFPPIRGRSRQHSTPTAVLYYPSATLDPLSLIPPVVHRSFLAIPAVLTR